MDRLGFDSELSAVRSGRPCVRVLGRDGVGKKTLRAALLARGIDVADGLCDADLYCFAGGLRATDRTAITALTAGQHPTIVVWTKADIAGSWSRADTAAADAARQLRQPVVPVMALLDDFDPASVPRLRRLAGSPLALPESIPDAAAELGVDADLLIQLGGYGLACAIGVLRQDPRLSDGALLHRLRELSAVDALLEPIGAAFVGFEERRRVEVDTALQAAALDPVRRDRAEHALLDRLARSA